MHNGEWNVNLSQIWYLLSMFLIFLLLKFNSSKGYHIHLYGSLILMDTSPYLQLGTSSEIKDLKQFSTEKLGINILLSSAPFCCAKYSERNFLLMRNWWVLVRIHMNATAITDQEWTLFNIFLWRVTLQPMCGSIFLAFVGLSGLF